MRKPLLIGGVAALTLAVAAGVALAQQPAPQGADRPAARAHRGDANSDGRISQAEFVNQRIERLTAADANGDGSVSREEMQARAAARGQQRSETRFARLDADNDGSISRAEFTAPRQARADGAPRPARAHGGPGRHGPRMARHAGQGGERAPVMIAEARTKSEQAFARLDADQDGFITGEERRAGRETRRERMSERRSARQASPQTPASE